MESPSINRKVVPRLVLGKNRLCLLIFIIALAIRLLCTLPVVIHPERSFGFGADSYQYDGLAKNMIEYHKFSVYPESSYMPEPARTPGYPFLVSVIYKLFGQKPEFVVLFQSILDSITAVLIFTLLLSIFSPLAGFISGLIYAVNLHQALYTTQILTEITFTFFLFISLFFLLKFYKSSAEACPRQIILSALLLGIATLIRPIALYFPIFICIWLIVCFKHNLKLTGKLSVLFLLVFMTVIVPWGIRNYRCFGNFFISNIDNINIACWNAAPVLARTEGITENEARKRIGEIVKNRYGLTDEEMSLFGDDPRISKLMRTVGLEIIRKNPGIYMYEHSLGFLKVFVHSELAYWSRLFYGWTQEKKGSMKYISKQVLRFILTGKIKAAFRLAYEERLQVMPVPLIFLWGFISVFELVIYVMALFGGIYLFKKNRALFFILILSIFYFAFVPGPVGDARFRVPIEPCISILAGCGIVNLIHINRSKAS